ncbi:hypothetical protein IWX90DRAFT_245064 [Phyllosticta citrichinensis]|uniref:Uncharacterized protein n=1 Tax=Phyllosticta citrichinensis TaxID=1130410 RepID=A0ABR1XQN7_9PEZI
MATQYPLLKALSNLSRVRIVRSAVRALGESGLCISSHYSLAEPTQAGKTCRGTIMAQSFESLDILNCLCFGIHVSLYLLVCLALSRHVGGALCTTVAAATLRLLQLTARLGKTPPPHLSSRIRAGQALVLPCHMRRCERHRSFTWVVRWKPPNNAKLDNRVMLRVAWTGLIVA